MAHLLGKFYPCVGKFYAELPAFDCPIVLPEMKFAHFRHSINFQTSSTLNSPAANNFLCL